MTEKEKKVVKQYLRFLEVWDSTQENKDMLRKAILYAADLHQGVPRKSGDPYILHPLEVARIVAVDLEMDTASIVAAILHDVVEDTEKTVEDIKAEFGEEVAIIVEGLTKINKNKYLGSKPKLKAENIKKLVNSFVAEPRVAIIKLADRLHNMLTLDAMLPEKQQSISSETEWLFIPLAHRLGLGDIKTKLGNETVKYSQEEKYAKFATQVAISKKRKKVYLNKIESFIYHLLNALEIKGKVEIQEKSTFELFRDMDQKQVDNIEFCSQRFTIKIIFEAPLDLEKETAFAIYSGLSDKYLYNSIHDYISLPRTNDFQALETSILNSYKEERRLPSGQWVNVSIMSERMYEISRKGYALKYNVAGKKNYLNLDKSNIQNWLNAISRLADDENSSSEFYIKRFEGYISMQNVIVFTRSGERKNLPSGSTVLDFAYAIHTDLANYTKAVSINNKKRSIFQELKNKDIINLKFSKESQVKEEWLHNVQTGRAMNAISNAISVNNSSLVKRGQEKLKEAMKKINVKYNDSSVQNLMNGFRIEKRKEFFLQFDQGKYSLEDMERAFYLQKEKSEGYLSKISNLVSFGKEEKKPPSSSLLGTIIHNGMELEMDTILIPSCCYPIPGDKIVGVPIQNNLTRIHRENCSELALDTIRFGGVSKSLRWKKSQSEAITYLAAIEFYGTDSEGLLQRILESINKNFNINMKLMRLEAHGKTLEGRLLLYTNGMTMLNKLIKIIKKNKGIAEVKRIEVIKDFFEIKN